MHRAGSDRIGFFWGFSFLSLGGGPPPGGFGFFSGAGGGRGAGNVEALGRADQMYRGDTKLDHQMKHRQPAVGSAADTRGVASSSESMIGKTSVAKYIVKDENHRRKVGRVTAHHADGIAAMDLFALPTISFRMLYGLRSWGHGQRPNFVDLGHSSSTENGSQISHGECGWEKAPAI